MPRANADAAGARRVTVVRITADDPRYEDARSLRYDCLYRQLGLPWTLVEDEPGHTFEHMVALDAEGTVVGYARLDLEDGRTKVLQVSVDERLRGSGIGRALMDAVMRLARDAGRDEVELDAREHAISFYERLGFVGEGPVFLSQRTGTPHRRMTRKL